MSDLERQMMKDHLRRSKQLAEHPRLTAEIAALKQQLAEVEKERDKWRQIASHPPVERATRRAEAAEAREKQVRAETIEECAKIIEDHQEVTSLRTNKRSLTPRTPGNLVGIAYADAIRAPASETAGEQQT